MGYRVIEFIQQVAELTLQNSKLLTNNS